MNIISRLFTALVLSLVMSVSAFASSKVDINRADVATLAAGLNGVGQTKAEAIVAYREKNGPFRSADQLAQVKGIGMKTIEKNREVIVVNAPAQPAAP